jgi:uncharacterized Zn-binding protein involved in type VI secretion
MFDGPKPHVGGPIMPPCEVTVLTGKLPQARLGDMATCAGPPDMIVKGSFTVLVGKKPAARMLDNCAHGGMIVKGEFTVLIGEVGVSTVTPGGMAMPGMGGMAKGGKAGKTGATDIAPVAELKGADAEAMKQAMLEAAQKGVPFCEQCWKAAHGAK